MIATTQAAIDSRDAGIRSSAQHAGEDWQANAVQWVYLHAVACDPEPFLAEDVRDVAERDGMAPAPDARAWGSVMRRAAALGHVEPCGFARARSSHMSPKVQWRLKRQ